MRLEWCHRHRCRIRRIPPILVLYLIVWNLNLLSCPYSLRMVCHSCDAGSPETDGTRGMLIHSDNMIKNEFMSVQRIIKVLWGYAKRREIFCQLFKFVLDVGSGMLSSHN